VPADVSVTGFDDAPIAMQLWPTLTTIKQPVREMGTTAAARLIAMIEDAAVKPGVDELRHSLVLRESVAAPAG
jgi:LacI family transcriptional regulator